MRVQRGWGRDRGDAFLGVSGIRSADSAAKSMASISEDLSFGGPSSNGYFASSFSGVPIQNQGDDGVGRDFRAGTGIFHPARNRRHLGPV